MRIGQRMYLALLPALLGVVTVAALAYWGQYAHEAPVWFVLVVAVATTASLVVAWVNARYVTRRVERLASTSAQGHGQALDHAAPDELETIESTVHHLSTVAGRAEAARQADETSLRDQHREYSELLSLSAREALQRLDDIRLPLHILLENHFGDLNENQEEMLAGARTAAEQAGNAFQRLSQIADLDRGAVTLRHDRIRPGDLVAGVLPALVAEGQQRNVHVTAEVAPALLSVVGDRGRLQLALELVLHDCLRRTDAGDGLRVTADVDGRDLVLRAEHGDGRASPIDMALGRRLIAAQGGRVIEHKAEKPENGKGAHRQLTEIRLAR